MFVKGVTLVRLIFRFHLLPLIDHMSRVSAHVLFCLFVFRVGYSFVKRGHQHADVK